jgi:hypothetical protein
MKRAHYDARERDHEEANAKFYMDEEQWTDVQTALAQADRHRPRKDATWVQAQLDCFLGVWRILFPEGDLDEPISPCKSGCFVTLKPSVRLPHSRQI